LCCRQRIEAFKDWHGSHQFASADRREHQNVYPAPGRLRKVVRIPFMRG
jgi:hypothetical protein